MEKYDLIVIGSGPAGEKAAVKAAYFGHKVAMVECSDHLGGGCVQSGTLPTMTMKETALCFSKRFQKPLFGMKDTGKDMESINTFLSKKKEILKSCELEIEKNLSVHEVKIYRGKAQFENANTIVIQNKETLKICADFILIATGSYPHRPKNIPFDDKRVCDTNSILQIEKLPRSICIIGAGGLGCEFATIFASLDVEVTLINDTEKILPFIDQEIAAELIRCMDEAKITMHFGDEVENIETEKKSLTIHLQSGKTLSVEAVLYAAGRNGNIRGLGCEKVGLRIGERETILVDEECRTNIPHIFAVGDVVGFPTLASTAMDQGRVAISHMFRTRDIEHIAKVIPHGVYTIPEISMVGMTEEEAIQQRKDYRVGKAYISNMPRGKIMGAKNGFLKIIFDEVSLEILGIHIIGPLAMEIIHYGMSLVEEKRNLYFLIGRVFNYPTLHDLYKYAAYDGLGNLTGHKVKK